MRILPYWESALPKTGTSANVTLGMATLRYLALGDSYTIGTGATELVCNFPSRLAKKIEIRTGVSVQLTNPAVNGFTSDDLIRAELPLIPQLSPHVATVLIGANDIVQGIEPDRYRRNLDLIYSELRRVGVKSTSVLAISIPNWAIAPGASQFGKRAELSRAIQHFNGIARHVSLQFGISFVEIFKLSGQPHADWISDDSLHPSDTQYSAWADYIWSAMGEKWITPDLVSECHRAK
jgi:acyl-CoA thioesterase I